MGGRIAYGAAKDGIFPSKFKSLDKNGSPAYATIISSLCCIPFLLLSLDENLIKQFNFVVDLSVSLIVIVYIFCMLSYLKFLQTYERHKKRHWVLGFTATLFCIWIICGIKFEMTIYSLSIFLTGAPVWYKKVRKKS